MESCENENVQYGTRGNGKIENFNLYSIIQGGTENGENGKNHCSKDTNVDNARVMEI